MLNKLQFNNLVISNKKGIQQSRIQTINKLVHKIRNLKTLLEKHPENTKCKDRIRKSTETMELLKKLKRVEIMKNVLLMDKPPAAVITNGLSTPEEVGVALLAMNKVMQGLIKRFKTELKLVDSESDSWKESLKESSKRRQKIERTEEKKRKRLEMKVQKAMGRNRQEWLEQQNQGEEKQVSLDLDVNVSTVGKWKIEELDESDEKVKTISKKNEKKKVTDLKRSVKDLPLKKNEIPNRKQKKENVIEVKQIIENELSEEEDKQETKQTIQQVERMNIDFSDEEFEQQDIIENDTNQNKDDTEDEPEEEILVVDPFFITDTGENYLSTAVIKRGQTANDENNEDKQDLHMIKLNSNKKPNDFRDQRQRSREMKPQNFREINNQTGGRYPQKQNRRNNEGNSQQKYQQNKWNNQNNQNEKFQQNKWGNRREKDQQIVSRDKEFKHQNKATIDKAEQNLHPSWAAKQKLKPVITSFQGKKITFGDDDNSNKTSNTVKNSKNQSTKLNNSDKDSLHPSWVAKQKLKPTITAFQGKKIKFDNDD